ncbi:hypothetical protein TKK_0013899 [Trichogramma kaykai]
MASWYRKFLENFATIAEPLTRLTRKGVKFTWAEDQQNSFEKIRGMLATAPVLNQPSFEHEFVIQTDASDTDLGAVLTEAIDRHGCDVFHFDLRGLLRIAFDHPASFAILLRTVILEANNSRPIPLRAYWPSYGIA